MPTLPTLEKLGQQPPLRPQLGDVARYQAATASETAPGMATAHFGEVVVNIGDSLYRMQAELTKARQSSELSDLLGKATEEVSVAEVGAQRDPGFATINERFSKQAEEIGSKYANMATDPLVKQSFSRRYQEISLSKRLNVMTHAASKEQNYHESQLDQSLDLVTRTAATTMNSAERDLLINQGRIYINEARMAGWISETDATKRERSLLSNVDEAVMSEDMRNNPGDTAVNLAVGMEYLPHLPADKRQAGIDHGITKAEQLRKEQEREEEKRKKDAQEKATVDAEYKFVHSQLTQGELDAQRETLGPTDYRRLSDALSHQGETRANDPAAFGALQRLLDKDPKAAAAQASLDYAEGKIKDSTLQTVRNEARTIMRETQPRSQYERSKAEIANLLVTSELLGDIVPKARMGTALAEFEDWFVQQSQTLKHPPTDAEVAAKANDVIYRYSIMDIKSLVRKTGRGTADADETINQITEEGRKLQQQLKDKQITPAQFGEKMKSLNEQRKAAETAKDARGK